MIDACRKAGVLLMYAEELCFAPKYVRAKQLVDEGALGTVFLVKQSEEHFGPHAPWFWDVDRSGGGVLLDMGCHSIEFAQERAAKMSIYVDKTEGEDHSFCVVEYGAGGLAENSWAKPGGVDDRCEIYGSGGFTRADLLRGSALLTYSEAGYGYAVEKAATTRGYTFTMFEEIWNYGFPQEMPTSPLRAGQGDAGRDGRRWPRGAEDHLRGLRSGRQGQAHRLALPAAEGKQAHRPVVRVLMRIARGLRRPVAGSSRR